METAKGIPEEAMNLEAPKESLSEEELGRFIEDMAVDREWFNRYKEISKFGLLSLFQGDKEVWQEQRDKFESGQIENPVFNYQRLMMGSLRIDIRHS